MSIDLKKLKQKLEQIKNPQYKTGKFEKQTWSPPKDGTQATVRFFQPKDAEDPFYELFLHYGVGKGPIICPRLQYGKECPICDFAFSLRKNKDSKQKNDPADLATFKSLMPKERYFGALIDRSDDDLKPKWYGFSKTMYGEFLEALLSEDEGEFMNVIKGSDVLLKLEPVGGASDFQKTSMKIRKASTPLHSDPKMIEKILSEVPDISVVAKPLTNAEISARLAEWLELNEENSGETTKSAKKEESNDDEKSPGSIEDIEDAFAKALED